MKKVKLSPEVFARIRVIGVGGSGGNVINHMIKSKLDGIEFIAANTDAQDLAGSLSKKKIHLGKSLARGLGTGMNSNLGRQSAEESTDEIISALKGSDLIFISCGMGGGTGTGASPVIAKIANELGILTIAVVTKPFSFEGVKRSQIAEEGIDELAKNVDAILVIPNDKILEVADKETTADKAFSMSDDVLLRAVRGISELITKPGDINVDFADIRTTMENSGKALMGVGSGKGEGRAEAAARQAVTSPLIDFSIKGARRILFSVSSKGGDIMMSEIQKIAEHIVEFVDPNANIIFGTSTDENIKNGEIRVTVIATSFDSSKDRNTNTPPNQNALGGFGSNIKKSKTKFEGIKRIGEDSLDNEDDEEDNGNYFSKFS